MIHISLPPTVDRVAVTDLTTDLRGALDSGDSVEIGCDKVELIGLAGFQLLVSAIRTGQARNVPLRLTGIEGQFTDLARLTGFGVLLETALDGAGDAA